MNTKPPVYQAGNIVLYKHRVTAIDFTPVKIVTVLGQDTFGIYWYIVVDDRRVVTANPEDWLKPAEGLTARQICRLNEVKPREEQLAELVVSTQKSHRLSR